MSDEPGSQDRTLSESKLLVRSFVFRLLVLAAIAVTGVLAALIAVWLNSSSVQTAIVVPTMLVGIFTILRSLTLYLIEREYRKLAMSIFMSATSYNLMRFVIELREVRLERTVGQLQHAGVHQETIEKLLSDEERSSPD